jgi:hypothetical protein
MIKDVKQTFVLSVYNVYNRRNAFSIYFRNNPDYPVNTEAVRYSVWFYCTGDYLQF